MKESERSVGFGRKKREVRAEGRVREEEVVVVEDVGRRKGRESWKEVVGLVKDSEMGRVGIEVEGLGS